MTNTIESGMNKVINDDIEKVSMHEGGVVVVAAQQMKSYETLEG